MQVKSIAECYPLLSTFVKLPFVIEIFILSIFEWLFYTGFTYMGSMKFIPNTKPLNVLHLIAVHTHLDDDFMH